MAWRMESRCRVGDLSTSRRHLMQFHGPYQIYRQMSGKTARSEALGSGGIYLRSFEVLTSDGRVRRLERSRTAIK